MSDHGFSWTAPGASRNASGTLFRRHAAHFNDRVRRSAKTMRCAERHDFSARSDPLSMRVGSKWRQARARFNRLPVDHGRRLKVVSSRENKYLRRGEKPRRLPRTGPTCLLRRPALQSAAGDVLARVHLDVRHPLRSRRWSSRGLLRRFLSSRGLTPRRALRFNVSRARALR